jgi:CheY-like chemotaxis protein
VVESIALEDVRILLVEDNVEHRETMTLLLQGYGARVYAAATAGEALSVWRSFQPHAIVSDIFLTLDTGLGLLRRLREAGCTVPAVAVTAWGDDDTRASAAAAGYAAHFAKPVSPKVLLATLARLLGRPSEALP